MENQAPSLDQWNEVASQGSKITVEQLDQMAKEYQEKYTQYETSKAQTTALYHEAEILEGKLIEAMEQAGKTKYVVEDIGTFFFSNKFVVPTPKTVEDKKALFEWLKTQHGETVLLDKQSINHQTLQSLYKEEFEAHVERCKTLGVGDPAVFRIPGLSEPTVKRSLNLRKAK